MDPSSTQTRERIAQLFNPTQRRAFFAELDKRKSLDARLRHERELIAQLAAGLRELKRRLAARRRTNEAVQLEMQLKRMAFIENKMRYDVQATKNRILNKEHKRARRETAKMKENLLIMRRFAERRRRR